ncbi:MAG: hypothetical protein GWP60_08930 [Gammaproteobacteria bacterium]|jgi:hypothetical protein|nr:hypothetical protein [Gammaproteobacteria bacterium]
MNRVTTIIAASSMLGACGGGSDQQTQTPAAGQDAATQTPVAVLTPDEKYSVTGKPQGPVRIDYRVIGTPVVGQPVTIDLVVKSNVGDEPVTLSYEMNDSTAMSFPATQQQTVSLAFPDEPRRTGQQVTVIPAREGRLFLNVTAHMQTDTGSLQTITAIPIQVGAAPRRLRENGVVTTDENGELLREMPASEN